MENSPLKLLDEAAEWSEKTFAQSTIQTVLTHLKREWRELEESDFSDPTEFADVVLLMNHLVFKRGFSLSLAIRDKFGINKGREWGEVDEDGVIEHVREKEWRGPGHVEHWNGEGEHPSKPSTVPVHFMKIGPNGEPFAIGATEKNAYLGMETFAPPVYPTYRVFVLEGQVFFQKMVYQNHSGNEDRWTDLPEFPARTVDITMRNKLMELLDMGIVAPIQLSVQTTVTGEIIYPVLNERWETVVETSGRGLTGRTGKVRSYRTRGKKFVGEIVWDE